jgi:hypothetical protein
MARSVYDTQPIWDTVALAAQLWCREDTQDFIMDTVVAMEFSRRIEMFEHQLTAELMTKCKHA